MLEGTSQPIVPAADSSGTPRRDRAPVPCEPPARPDAAVEAESSRAPENARRTAEATAARHAAEVAALRRQVLEARKQAALGELLGTTAHEFNNALTTILNYARMGLRHRDQTTRDKALERILSAGTRAARIASSVLSMSRSRSPRLEPTDLVHVVEDVLVLLERELMKYRVQVEREFAAVPRVMANPGQVQQVLLNLLVNARQAMPQGGRLILRLVHDQAAGLVDLTVRDTGCGMTPEVMRRIFEPHFTTKAGPDETGKGGTGLGLASCREIVEAHRGRIRVESAPGRGTAITIRLPVPQAAAA
ncbi:MAG: sensor histidine kinase [Planctomycetia bacterium]|jgi:signal transduction histidine kinase